MGVTVCCTSTDIDLATTGSLRAILFGATATSTANDTVLSNAIRRASAWVESYLGAGTLSLQSYVETVPGYGTRSLMLSRTPLRSVSRLMYGTDSGSATVLDTSSYRIESNEAALVSRDEGFEWSPLLEGRAFDASVPLSLTPLSGQEWRPWCANFSAGWTWGIDTGSPNWSTEKGTTSTGRTLPEDVEFATLLKAQEIFEGGAEVQSEKLGDLEVNYRSLGTDKDGRTVTRYREMLEPYRRYA